MKCLVINGSGRENGNTFQMCQTLIAEMKHRNVDIEKFSPGNEISHCTGCGLCVSGTCPLVDTLTPVIKSLPDYDLILFASPIRFSGLSSQIKTVIDRMNPIWHSKYGGPRSICAVLIGGSDAPNFRNAISELRSVAIGTGAKWLGALEISDTDCIPVGIHGKEVTEFIENTINLMQT